MSTRPDNRENLMSLADQLVWAIDNYVGGGVQSVPQTVGTIYYVDGTNGDSGNDGLSPDEALDTITGAITAASAGDYVIVRAGTYDEDVDINKASLHIVFEHGVIINNQSAIGFLVSSNYCYVCTPYGSTRVNPVAEGTGVYVSGNWNYVHDIRVPCDSTANIGFDIAGDGCVVDNCRSSNPLVAAFKIQGDMIKLLDCCTGGEVADTSIGFWVTESSNKFRIKNCGSQGHASGSFVVDSGCTNGGIDDCYSGEGDGRWLDPDHASVWTNFAFDNIIDKVVTFAGAPTTYNLFKITGAVEILDIYGLVETVLPATSSDMHLSLYSTGGEVDVTNDVGAPDVASAPVGSILIRLGEVTDTLVYKSSATPSASEASAKQLSSPLVCNADYDQDTFLRINLTVALASGAIHWHCKWRPLGDRGFVEAA